MSDVAWPFGALAPLSFSVIVADPPWAFELYSEEGNAKSASAHYETMDLEAIRTLPVGYLARGDALLLLWTAGCMLPQALNVMEAWGFQFKSEMIWRKTTRKGKVRMGPGYRVRTMHEPILVGTIGNPKHKAFPSVIDGIAREHSRKPDEFYAMVKEHTFGAAAVDLFSRQVRPGFDGWGREHGKFDGMSFDPPEVLGTTPPPGPIDQLALPMKEQT